MPASAEKKQILRDLIDVFYRAAGFHGWSGEVNESVAQVFTTMLCSAKRCINALGWVPAPPGGPPSIAWFAQNLGRIAVYKMREYDLSTICIRKIIRTWRTPLRIASTQGFATGAITPCYD